jgi:hypothetical protein
LNTTVVIVDTASRTVLWLALIGSGLKIALAVVPQFRIAAPKEPTQPKQEAAAKAPESADPGLIPLGRAS